MSEPPKKNAPKTFDIHRTLPTHPHRPPVSRHHTHPTDPVAPPPVVPTRQKPLKPPRPLWRRILKWLMRLFILLVIAALGLLIFIGVWDQRNISAATKKMFNSSNLVALARGGALKTDNYGRVNVLLVGYSADDPGHQGAKLTDSILLLSMNPATHTGYLLSIPRDLYVAIPGNGYGKINEVYEDGGMGLLEQVVDTDLGVSINYYAIIGYTAVKDIVNALGGISVNIQSPDPRGLYDPNINAQDGGPLKLSNGIQTLDGQAALNLTRARGDAYNSYGFPQSDFDRTQHQRQVFAAIKTKLNWKLVLNPRQNSQILNAVAANIKTDVKINEVRALFGLFNSIPNSKLQSLSLNSLNGKDMLQSYITYGGQDALVPAVGPTDFSQIDTAIQQLNQ